MNKEDQKKKLILVSDILVIDKVFRVKAPMKIDKLITELEQGETIVICDLKFLAPNMKKLLERLNAIETKGATLEVLNVEGNSLAAHAAALSEFDKFIRGTKISRGMVAEAYLKRCNGGVHSRSRIQNYGTQRSIALAKSTGEKTVQELATEHNVTRQVIYRICKDPRFKYVHQKPYYSYDFERWNLDKCMKKTTAYIRRSGKEALVAFFMTKYNIVVYAYKTKDKDITYEKAEADFFSYPRKDLQERYDIVRISTILKLKGEKMDKEELDTLNRRIEKLKSTHEQNRRAPE